MCYEKATTSFQLLSGYVTWSGHIFFSGYKNMCSISEKWRNIWRSKITQNSTFLKVTTFCVGVPKGVPCSPWGCSNKMLLFLLWPRALEVRGCIPMSLFCFLPSEVPNQVLTAPLLSQGLCSFVLRTSNTSLVGAKSGTITGYSGWTFPHRAYCTNSSFLQVACAPRKHLSPLQR